MIFCTNEEGNELVIYFFFFSSSCQPARETFKYGMVVSYYLVLYHHDLPAEELCIDVAFYQSIILDVVTMCRCMASFGTENFKDKNFPKGFSSVFNIKCKMVLRKLCDDWDI